MTSLNMAHFAEINGSNIVLRVIVIDDNDCKDGNGNESEAVGIAFCKSLLGSDTNWVQTSYNTKGGRHSLGGTPFRKNYADIGSYYDSSKNAFYWKDCPYPDTDNWTFNEDTCVWDWSG